MKPDMFETPVVILTGLGFPTKVKTVMDAYRLLLEWPASRHDPERALTLKACRAALNGKIGAETARRVFAAFAEKHDVLAPDVNVVVAGQNRRDSNPHMR
jgi:Protein of unknown function (DUF982)